MVESCNEREDTSSPDLRNGVFEIWGSSLCFLFLFPFFFGGGVGASVI